MKPLITMIVPYYRQPNMLWRQLDEWALYPSEVRDAFRFIVVDDGSPEPTAQDLFDSFALSHPGAPFLLPSVSLYRIDKDVPWNRGMARNLGTHVADTDWILHVDTDHVLPQTSATALVRMWPAVLKMPKTWYRFRRIRVGAADETRMKDAVARDASVVEIHPHIDSYLCTRDAYWKAGGYNEDFSGVLGGGSPFLKEMEKANGVSAIFEAPLHVHTRHSVSDSSEFTLPRSPEAFAQRKREIMKARGTLRGHDPLRLPWHKVF